MQVSALLQVVFGTVQGLWLISFLCIVIWQTVLFVVQVQITVYILKYSLCLPEW